MEAAAVEDESSTSSASPEDKRKNIFRNPEDLAQFVISGMRFLIAIPQLNVTA